jgi:hypothetical protein
MKIRLQGEQDMDWMSFEPLTDISRSTCMVEARLGGHGVRDDLPLLGILDFCAALRDFIAERGREPVLQGAYDFQLTFSRRPAGIWAQFYIAKFILQDDGVHGRLALSGGFTVPSDTFSRFAEGFLDHFESQFTENDDGSG